MVKKTIAQIGYNWEKAVWRHEAFISVCSYSLCKDYLYSVNNRQSDNNTCYNLTIPKAFANAKAGKVENAEYIVLVYENAIITLKAYKKAVDGYKGKKVCNLDHSYHNGCPITWTDDNTMQYSPILQLENYQKIMLDMHRIVRDYAHTAKNHPTTVCLTKEHKIEILLQEGFVEEAALVKADLTHLISYAYKKDEMGFALCSEEFNKKEFLKSIMRDCTGALKRRNWDTKIRPHLIAFHKAVKDCEWDEAKKHLQLAADAGEEPEIIAGLQTHIAL